MAFAFIRAEPLPLNKVIRVPAMTTNNLIPTSSTIAFVKPSYISKIHLSSNQTQELSNFYSKNLYPRVTDNHFLK